MGRGRDLGGKERDRWEGNGDWGGEEGIRKKGGKGKGREAKGEGTGNWKGRRERAISPHEQKSCVRACLWRGSVGFSSRKFFEIAD
jgi:hypothetical protein